MSFVTLCPSELHHQALLKIAGAECVLQTNSAEILASLELWRARGDPSTRLRAPFTIRIRMREGQDQDKDQDEDSLSARLQQPRFRGRHHLVFAVFGTENVFIFDLLKREVTATVSAAMARDAHFWKAVLIPIAMGVMGASLHTVPLHAACLAYQEHGVLITGESGAGKSTLAVALALRGLGLISDDWTYIESGRNHLVAHGLEVPVKLLPDAVRHFPQLQQHETAISMNGELAYEVPADAVFPIVMRRSCVPTVLLYLERTRDVHSHFSAWAPDLVRDHFLRNAELLPSELVHAAESRAEAIHAISRLPAFVFHAAGTPQQSAQAIAEFIESRRFESRFGMEL